MGNKPSSSLSPPGSRRNISISRRSNASRPSSDVDSSSSSSNGDENSPSRAVRRSRARSSADERGRSRGRARHEDMSYFQMARLGYQELVNAIIRPPRARYHKSALGPKRFRFHGRVFKRTDFELENARGMALQCSHWEPDGWRVAEQLPCVVYLHGNSSARPETLPQLELVLSLGATMFSFDCSGSGLSDGEYVSLGYWERDDLEAVIEYLRASGDVGAIALWGRSMGAATALLHGDRDPGIAAMVLDSAFADLTQLAQEMVQRGRDAGLSVPSLAVKIALRMVKSSVLRAAGFNIKDLCPIRHADRTYIPALFIAASGDEFIQPHHTQNIHDAYAGDKNIIIVEGDHNSSRPQFLQHSIYIFLQNYLRIPPEWSLLGTDISYGDVPVENQAEDSYTRSGNIPNSEFLSIINGINLDQDSQVQIQEALFQMLSQQQDARESVSPIRADVSRSLPEKTTLSSSNQNSESTLVDINDEVSITRHREYPGVEIIEDYTGKDNAGERGQPKQKVGPNRVARWPCGSCTLINEGYVSACTICGMPKSGPKSGGTLTREGWNGQSELKNS